jgi:hypothetical protein
VVLNVTSRPTATNPALGLSVASEIGLHHEVQASTNLVDWNILATLTSTNFSTHLVDPNAGLYPRRFYRTRELTQ